jgi:hypothetical protein
MQDRKSGFISNYHGLPYNEIMPCLPFGRTGGEIVFKHCYGGTHTYVDTQAPNRT